MSRPDIGGSLIGYPLDQLYEELLRSLPLLLVSR